MSVSFDFRNDGAVLHLVDEIEGTERQIGIVFKAADDTPILKTYPRMLDLTLEELKEVVKAIEQNKPLFMTFWDI